MCAISGWSGKLPKGLISRLLVRMEVRGRDAIGIAFRLDGLNTSYRQAVTATEFVADKENSTILGDARRSLRGIIHTRRASPGMPIDDRNSHPFGYWRYFFAHNGKIQNWKEIKTLLIDHFRSEAKKFRADGDEGKTKTAEYCVDYCSKITTDSMVLGPYIESRDFSAIVGCMGLVWMRGSNVYTFRYAKEAVAATIAWRYVKDQKDETTEDHIVTIVASTPQIIQSAIEKVPDIEFDMGEPKEFAEGRIFKVEPTGLLDEGKVPTNEPVADEFSSEAVEPMPCDPMVEPVVETAWEKSAILKRQEFERTMDEGYHDFLSRKNEVGE